MGRSVISVPLGVLTDNVTFALLDGVSMNLYRILRQFIGQSEFSCFQYFFECLMD